MQIPTIDFKHLFESSPGLYLVLSPDLTIVAVSENYLKATMTERSSIIGRYLFDVFPDNPDDADATGVSNLGRSLGIVLKDRKPHKMDWQKYDIRKPDGTFEVRYWSPLNTPVLNVQQEVILIIHQVEDVTETVRLRIQHEKDEEELRHKAILMENVSEAVIATDDQYYITDWNKFAEELYGWSNDEATGKLVTDLLDIIYPLNNEAAIVEEYRKKGYWRGEVIHHDKSGQLLNVIVTSSAIKNDDNLVTGLLMVSRDITTQKQMEQELRQLNYDLEEQVRLKTSELVAFYERFTNERKIAEIQLQQSRDELRQLASHLQNVREEEQTRIAREIHDQLGQEMTGLKMDVAWLKKAAAPEQEAFHKKLNEMSALLDISIQSVRKIASNLRPSILDDFGLEAALQWQSNEFEKRFSIPVKLETNGNEPGIPPDTATGLFRLFQESLTNVARHANASQVNASLDINGDKIMMKIADNGKGFDISQTRTKSLGLLGMKERTLMLKGKLDITSKPGEGTLVTITVPYEKQDIHYAAAPGSQ